VGDVASTSVPLRAETDHVCTSGSSATVAGSLASVAAIGWLVRHVLRIFGLKVGEHSSFISATEELRGTVDLLHKEGSVEKLDRDMFGGLLDLQELTVADVAVELLD